MMMIARQGFILGAIGLTLGGLLVVWVTRLVNAVFNDLVPVEATPVVMVGILLALVTVVASLLPARRAAGVDPIVALRCE